VSVVRDRGTTHTEAEVIACQTRVSITPGVTEEELALKAEYTEFLEATDLDRLRPEQEIEFTFSGAYQTLLEHIAAHRHFLGLERERAIPRQEAVLSWYDNVYQPLLHIIRQHDILVAFPGRTEADLYLWITEHHHYLRERREVSLAESAEHFAREYGRRPWKKALRSIRHLLETTVRVRLKARVHGG